MSNAPTPPCFSLLPCFHLLYFFYSISTNTINSQKETTITISQKDSALEAWARNVSQRCIFGHIDNWNTDDIDINIATFADPRPFVNDFRGIGENIAISSGEPTINLLEGLTNTWINEGHQYGYGTVVDPDKSDPDEATCGNSNGCGHFTQV